MMEEIIEYLNRSRIFYLATCEGDQPRVRPFGFALLYEGQLYFSTLTGKPVYEQLLANPKVELCCLGREQTWIRICGTATESTDPAVYAERDRLREESGAKPLVKDFDKVHSAEEMQEKLRLFRISDGCATIYGHFGIVKQVTF